MIVGRAATCIGEAFINPQSDRPFNISGCSVMMESNGA